MRRHVAYTTIATTLDRLYVRGLLACEAKPGHKKLVTWRYKARVTRQQLLCAAIAQLANDLGAD